MSLPSHPRAKTFQPLYTSGRYYGSNMVSVCWLSPETRDAPLRALTRQAVTHAWSAVTTLRFNEWDACTPADIHSPIVKIRVVDDIPGDATGLSRIGPSTTSRADEETMTLERVYVNSRPEFFGRVAVHEFGHSIGFFHEHSRPDTPAECNPNPQGEPGATALGEYDDSSVMNYCARTNPYPYLSRRDVTSVQKVYTPPPSPIRFFRPAVSSTWHPLVGAVQTWGERGDIPTPGDYNGDGTPDIAVWRPSSASWYISGSTTVVFGNPQDIPVQADYDGDGKTDIAVWRPSNGLWQVRNQFEKAFGSPGDIPVPGDWDGDLKADLAVFRPSDGTWRMDGKAPIVLGYAGDVPVPADYNGDGQLEPAVWNPQTGEWSITNVGIVTWGSTGDLPVPADYTGDGKADVAFWRPSTGTWQVKEGESKAWGSSTDIPVPTVINRAVLARLGLRELPMQLTCPANLTVEATAEQGAPVPFRAAVSDYKNPVQVSYSQPPGSQFPLGTTGVDVSVKNSLGQTQRCRFDVTVQDTTAPKLSCPREVFLKAAPGQTSAAARFAPEELRDEVSTPSLMTSHASGSSFPLGTTPVTLVAKDAAGNQSDCTFQVIVEASNVKSADAPAERKGGCNSAPGEGALLWVGTWLWTLMRRRARAPSP